MGCGISRPAYVAPVAPVAVTYGAPAALEVSTPAVAVGPSLSIDTGGGGGYTYGYGGYNYARGARPPNVYVNKTVNVRGAGPGAYGRSFARRGAGREFFSQLRSSRGARGADGWCRDGPAPVGEATVRCETERAGGVDRRRVPVRGMAVKDGCCRTATGMRPRETRASSSGGRHRPGRGDSVRVRNGW